MFGTYTSLDHVSCVLTSLITLSGIYCLLTVATLLNILTPDLLSGVPEFIVSCQTYEGGFGNASFPDWAFTGQYVRFSYLRSLLDVA